MNKLKLYFTAGVLVVAGLAPEGSEASINNPVTLAVIQVYDAALRENPNDYMTWYKRANEYYRHSEYVHALDDVNNALAFAPSSDSDTRFQAYMLRAGIYNQTGKHDQALADLESAIAIDPNSYAAIYQKANTEFELGNFAQARTDYSRLQRINSRSTEAAIGLARCSVKENNLSAATDFLQQAVDFDPNNPEIYVRRASVRRLMGDHNGAVDDLVLAISLNSKDPKAIEALVEYGNTNYAATIAGLTNAIQLAPGNGLYRYLRASIAQAHYNYISAINDFQQIIDDRLYNYHGINASIARCLYGLGRYQEALDQIDTALNATGTVPEYYVLRSQILRAMGRHEDAFLAASRTHAVDPDYAPGLVELALNYIDKNDYQQAAQLLGEANMTDANDPSIYLMRGWLLENYLNQPVAAKNFYEQALDVEGYGDRNIKSLRGFALYNLGRTDEADQWFDTILTSVPDNDGLNNYYAACYYSMRGDTDRAIECAERSLKAGYSDNHNWMSNNDGQINVGTLRDDLRFLRLMQKYNSIFGN
ncbi:MAG: tetratricopeptide repeat protein [Muribaculaceae bacterium]|nr:tetratricopeptide repeat protein [Muribaculaceae bacterium]